MYVQKVRDCSILLDLKHFSNFLMKIIYYILKIFLRIQKIWKKLFWNILWILLCGWNEIKKKVRDWFVASDDSSTTKLVPLIRRTLSFKLKRSLNPDFPLIWPWSIHYSFRSPVQHKAFANTICLLTKNRNKKCVNEEK
jgi:hypothetical protein